MSQARATAKTPKALSTISSALVTLRARAESMSAPITD